MLMPGVLSHATDLVEHPEMIAERLVNYAERVGRENVQTGTDCGIGSRVGHEEVVWAKIDAMSEGAAIASKQLWQRQARSPGPSTGPARQSRRVARCEAEERAVATNSPDTSRPDCRGSHRATRASM